MRNVRTLVENINRREKVLLLASILLAVVLAVYFILLAPFFTAGQSSEEQIKSKEMLLAKYKNLLSKENDIKARLRLVQKEYDSISKRLYTASTEEIANAEIQSDVKSIALRNGLSVSRSTFQRKELLNNDPRLVGMFVSIEIKDINSVSKLQKFLYDVRSNADRVLFLDDLQIKTKGFTAPNALSLSATLVAIANIEGKS